MVGFFSHWFAMTGDEKRVNNLQKNGTPRNNTKNEKQRTPGNGMLETNGGTSSVDVKITTTEDMNKVFNEKDEKSRKWAMKETREKSQWW